MFFKFWRFWGPNRVQIQRFSLEELQKSKTDVFPREVSQKNSETGKTLEVPQNGSTKNTNDLF